MDSSNKESVNDKMQNSKFIAKFTEISVKVGNWVYLRSLRDAFAVILPMFIVAGILVAPMIGYSLARNKGFNNPIAAAAMSLASIFILMPGSIQLGTVASAGGKNGDGHRWT